MGIIKPQQPRLQRSHPLSIGLEAAWLMNEGTGITVYDQSERAVNPLNLAGYSGPPAWVGGNNGWALSFANNGNNPWAQSALATIPVGAAFTLAVWVMPSGNQQSLGRLAEMGDWTAQCALGFGNTGAGGGYHWAVNGVYTNDQGVDITGQWQHIAGTFAGVLGGTGTKILYVDGVPVETVTGVNSPAQSSVQATVSAYDGNLGAYTGLSTISDIRFWSRCLSPDEINTLRLLTGP